MMPRRLHRNTVDRRLIEERFKALGLDLDWKALEKIADIRNDAEYLFMKATPSVAKEVLSSALPLIEKLVAEHLEDDPVALFSADCWAALLENRDVFEQQFARCQETYDAMSWTSEVLGQSVEELRCPACGSSLVRQTDPDNDSFSNMFLECLECGSHPDREDVFEAAIDESTAGEAFVAAKDGGLPPVQLCHDCGRETWIVEEQQCAFCEAGLSTCGIKDAYGTREASRDGTARSQTTGDAFRHKTLDRKIIDLLNNKRNTLATGSYVDWRNIGFGVRAKYRGTELETEAYDAFVAFSLSWEHGTTERRDIDKLWNSEKDGDGKRIGPGTAVTILRRLPSNIFDDAADQPEEAAPLPPASEISAQFTGLAKRLYQQLTLASDRQASNIQLAGVLATLSAVIGPSAVIQNGVKGKCCTNLYSLSLAKTGAGKETIRTLVSSALNAANRGTEVFDGAPSDVSFNAALSRLGGRSALLIDEAGIIAKANKASSNSHQRLLIALLMKA